MNRMSTDQKKVYNNNLSKEKMNGLTKNLGKAILMRKWANKAKRRLYNLTISCQNQDSNKFLNQYPHQSQVKFLLVIQNLYKSQSRKTHMVSFSVTNWTLIDGLKRKEMKTTLRIKKSSSTRNAIVKIKMLVSLTHNKKGLSHSICCCLRR